MKINISRRLTRSPKGRWKFGANMRVDFIKGATVDAQNPLDIRVEAMTCITVLRLRLECKLMNKVAKKVVHILEVGHNLVHFSTVEHEGSSRRELDVPRNFVHFDGTNDVASLVGLFVQLVLPLLLYALLCGGLALSGSVEKTGSTKIAHLVDGVWIVERPAAIHVRFSHFITGLAAPRVRRETTVTAAAPAWVVQGHKFLELGLRMDADFGVEDGSHRFFVEPGLHDKVGDVALGLAANVCHVDAEHLHGVRVSIC